MAIQRAEKRIVGQENKLIKSFQGNLKINLNPSLNKSEKTADMAFKIATDKASFRSEIIFEHMNGAQLRCNTISYLK